MSVFVLGKPDLWASIVAGRKSSLTGSSPKPIPGTTLTLSPHPSLPIIQQNKSTVRYTSQSETKNTHHIPTSTMPLPQPEIKSVSKGVDVEGNIVIENASPKVQFYIEDASSVGSRASTDSGLSEQQTSVCSYADACKRTAVQNACAVSEAPSKDFSPSSDQETSGSKKPTRVENFFFSGQNSHTKREETVERNGWDYHRPAERQCVQRGRGSRNASGYRGRYYDQKRDYCYHGRPELKQEEWQHRPRQSQNERRDGHQTRSAPVISPRGHLTNNNYKRTVSERFEDIRSCRH